MTQLLAAGAVALAFAVGASAAAKRPNPCAAPRSSGLRCPDCPVCRPGEQCLPTPRGQRCCVPMAAACSRQTCLGGTCLYGATAVYCCRISWAP